jgi:aerobic carbon-monoxide dehydrogenase medium subunit
MGSVSFDFERPHSLDAAKRLISTPGAVLIAGGQSLVPLLNQREIEPTLVVDLSRVDELKQIACDGDSLRIGAMATLTEIMNDKFVAAFPLLQMGIASTANPPVRNCATLVGNLIRANALGELSTIAVALGARLIMESVTSKRTVETLEFFIGHFRTSVASDEIVTCAEFPKPKSSHQGSGFSEITRRAGIPPMVCTAVSLEADERGTISQARVAVGGVAERPMRCPKTELGLLGTSYEAAFIGDVDEGFEPAVALRHSSYAIAVLPVVIRRALHQAVAALKASYSKER